MSSDIIPIASTDNITQQDKIQSLILMQKDSNIGNNVMTMCNIYGVYGFDKQKDIMRLTQQQKMYGLPVSKASNTYSIVKKLNLQSGDVAYSNDKAHITLKGDKINILNDVVSLKEILSALKTANTALFTAISQIQVIDPISGPLPLSPQSVSAIENVKNQYTEIFTNIEKLIG